MEKEKKIRILKAAQKRFVRHGMHKTTLDEIARDLRIGKATIYHYFTSKEELYYETLKWEGNLYFEEAEGILSGENLTLNEKIKQYVELKENLIKKYSLIYEASLCLFRDIENDKEREFIAGFIKKEEEVIKKAAALPNINKLSSFIVMQSWSLLFYKKLSHDENLIVSLKEDLINAAVKIPD